MYQSQWFRIALLIFPLLLIIVTPAAASDADHKGWYLAVEAASTTPGNVNTPLMASTPGYYAIGGSMDIESNVEYMDFDSDVSGRVTLGYSWGKSGRLQVTFWDYSDDEAKSGFSAYYPSYRVNFFTIGPLSNFYNGSYYYYSDMSFDMTQELEATTVDIEFLRPVSMESENLTVTWGIGLRYTSFEDEVVGEYVLDPLGLGPGTFRFPVTREVESDGIGMTGSMGVEYTFPSRLLGISSNLRVGFIVSDVDSNHSITDLDGYYSGYTVSQSVSMEDEVGNTVDFEANLVFHANDRLDFDVGWFYSTWTGMSEVALSRTHPGGGPIFLGGPGPTIPGEDRERITFSGPKVRARFRF